MRVYRAEQQTLTLYLLHAGRVVEAQETCAAKAACRRIPSVRATILAARLYRRETRQCVEVLALDVDIPAAFPHHTLVIIRSGTNAGKRGVTLGYDREDGMYEVELTEGGIKRSVFLDRKSLLPQYEVLLITTNRAAKPRGTEHEVGHHRVVGRGGAAIRGAARWRRGRVRLEMKNMMLPAGARCQVHGLASAAQHNGTVGRVVGFDEDETGRYDVEYTDATGALAVLRVERKCVRL
jgi:hypothetical protein